MSEDNNTLPPKLGTFPPLHPKKEAPVVSFEERAALKEKDKDASLDTAAAPTVAAPIIGINATNDHLAVWLRALADKMAADQIDCMGIFVVGKQEGDTEMRFLSGVELIQALGMADMLKQFIREEFAAALQFND